MQWLAYPVKKDRERVKTERNTVGRTQKEALNCAPFYGQPVKNTPKTFVAISEVVGFDYDRDSQFRCSANAPNYRELVWTVWYLG
jgi:hypothetical protein